MRFPFVTLLIAACIFATGAAGLVYEIVWQRYLQRLLGSDHLATAVTLAVFFAGLSLGYALCGSLTTRVRNHLRTYALLEAAIGAWALGFPWIFAMAERLSGSWTFHSPWLLMTQGVAAAAILLIPPTLLMGATVPFLTRIIATTVASLTRVHALVYSVNAAGACVGALAAAFWLVPTFGLPGTLARAACLNLAAGAVFLSLSVASTRIEALPGTAPKRPTERRFSPRLLCAIVTLSGVETMALENVLFRYTSIVFGSSTPTFAIVVAVFVAAIAVGGTWVSRARRLARWTLSVAQLSVAASLTFIWFTLDSWPYWAYLLRLGFGSTVVGFYLYYAAVLLFLFVLFAIPVLLLGTVVPVVFHEYLSGVATAGRTSGRLLAWNAGGGLVGSTAGGALLYNWLDLAQVYLIVPLLASFGAMLCAAPLGRGVQIVFGCALPVIGAVLILQPTHDASRLIVGTHRIRDPLPYAYWGADLFYAGLYHRRSIRFREDGPLSTVAVIETTSTTEESSRALSLFIDGRSNSDTRADAITLRLAAHLPALWSVDRSNVLIVGLGTGVTAGELTLYPDVQRIDVAEISPSVVRALPYFDPVNNEVVADPRMHIHVEDAFALLRRHPRKWNVIISEPSHLWVSHSNALYTREFYRLVNESLAEGGIFLQWIHLYDADIEIVGTIGNTLRAEFPFIQAFGGATRDLLMMVSKRPFSSESVRRARGQFQRLDRVRASLAEIDLFSIDEIIQREQTSFGRWFEHRRGVELHTLDYPRLGFLAARAAFLGSIAEVSNLEDRVILEERLWELERMLRDGGDGDAVDKDH